MLSTMLLADAVNKGGPGSGPQGGRSLSPFKDHSGKRVTINNPGSSVHGVTGRIIRQIGNESAIDTGGDQTIWAKTEHLREA